MSSAPAGAAAAKPKTRVGLRRTTLVVDWASRFVPAREPKMRTRWPTFTLSVSPAAALPRRSTLVSLKLRLTVKSVLKRKLVRAAFSP